MVKLLTLEGNQILWTQKDAISFKAKFLSNQKLDQLVKERIQDFSTPVYPNNHFDVAMINELQSLLKQAEGGKA